MLFIEALTDIHSGLQYCVLGVINQKVKARNSDVKFVLRNFMSLKLFVSHRDHSHGDSRITDPDGPLLLMVLFRRAIRESPILTLYRMKNSTRKGF